MSVPKDIDLAVKSAGSLIELLTALKALRAPAPRPKKAPARKKPVRPPKS